MKKTTLLLALGIVASLPASAELQHGWNAEYWEGACNFDQPEAAIFTQLRIERGKPGSTTGIATLITEGVDPVTPVIDFEWYGNMSPRYMPAEDVDVPDEVKDMSFCCKWTGYLVAPEDDIYTFDMTWCDDGFSLKIYDVDDMDTPLGENSLWNDFAWDRPDWVVPDVELTKDHVYFIEAKHYEYDNGAHARLCWFSDNMPKEVIPESVMYTTNPNDGASLKEVLSASDASVKVRANNGSISLKGLSGQAVKVYNLQGMELYSTTAAEGDLDIPASQGVKLVSVGSKASKVFVK